MTTSVRHLAVPPDRVWDVLADGWLYPVWVVGAARMRAVDDAWPATGSRLHHSAGSWPALVDDVTVVTDCRPGERLALRARGWPAGEADVVVSLIAAGTGTDVRLDEDAASGPGRLVPKPVRHAGLRWRNAETLRRLAYLAEGRTRQRRAPCEH